MKSKFTRKAPEVLEEEEIEEVEVEADGPKIASAKKNKIMIVAFATVLAGLVYYFMFSGEEPPKKDPLEELPVTTSQIGGAASEDGKSPFEIAPNEDKAKDAELFEKPAAPEIPALPELPKELLDEQKAAQVTAPNPNDLTQQQNSQNLQQSNNQLPGQDQSNQNASSSAQNGSLAQNPDGNSNNNSSNKDLDVDPRYSPILVLSGSDSGVPTSSVGYDNNIVNLSDDPIRSLEKVKPGVTATYIEDRSKTIAQGKLITAVLETAINTEIPGLVRSVVSRDVYGESGAKVLIPKGSRLYGSYSSKIVRGQGRVQINWTRLIRPDGVSLSINSNASDQFGRAGIAGDTDNRYGAIVANSLLTSVLAIGSIVAAQKLTGNNTATTTTNPIQGTVTSTNSSAGQAMYDVTKTIIDTVGQIAANSLNTAPVIRVPQGTKITVIVNSDINIPYSK